MHHIDVFIDRWKVFVILISSKMFLENMDFYFVEAYAGYQL